MKYSDERISVGEKTLVDLTSENIDIISKFDGAIVGQLIKDLSNNRIKELRNKKINRILKKI